MQRKPDLFDYIIERPRLSILAGILLIFMGFLVSDLPKMAITLTWLKTSGRIISHQIQKVKIKEYDDEFYEETHVYIRYEYVMGGRRYESNSINAHYLPFYSTEVAEQYPIDKIVVVYYNPKDPTEAVLEPGFIDPFISFDVFSYLFFIAGIYFIRVGIIRRKEDHFWQNYNSKTE